MSAVTPIKRVVSEGGFSGFSEFETGDSVPVSLGGTGVTSVQELIDMLTVPTGVPVSQVINEVTSITITKPLCAKRHTFSSSLDATVTVPLDDGSFSAGDWIEFTRTVGAVYFLASDGVTLNSKNNYKQIDGIHGVGRLTYFGDNKWHLTGDLMAGNTYVNSLDLTGNLYYTSSNDFAGVSGYMGVYGNGSGGTYNSGINEVYKSNSKLVISGSSTLQGSFVAIKPVSPVNKKIGVEVVGTFLAHPNGALGTSTNISIGFCAHTIFNSGATKAGCIVTKNGIYTDGGQYISTSISDITKGTLFSYADIAVAKQIKIRVEISEAGVMSFWVNDTKMAYTQTVSISATLRPYIAVSSGKLEISSIKFNY